MAVETGGLLEREYELATLREGLDSLATGDGTLVLIEGPAGAGKTMRGIRILLHGRGL